MRRLALSALALGLSLSACANKEDVVPADQDETADAAAASAGVPVNAEDFAREQLGARIQGPAGPEVEGSLATADGTALGDIESYVACPSNIDSCDPASLPDGTVYTFVHIVTPGVDKPNDDAMAQPETVKRVEKSVTFRMTMPADGFAGQAGYSLEQARAALGPDGTFTISCQGGMLIWEVATGETWGTGEPVTFFWKSTKPPKGPAKAYGFEADGFTSTGTGPFPAPAADGAAVVCS